MANTMKFGNGQWATKEDSILAYNDENANFKPLPFVTSRASTATRVNKAGLLETVASGIPRVDYLGNTKGAYLLEPQSTNLITQSEAFGNSYWTKSGASIKGDTNNTLSEKVVNGDFATNLSGWTNTAGVTWNSGNAKYNGSSGDFYQGGYELGKIYLVTLDYTRISGQLNVNIGSALNPISTGSGGSLSIQVNSFGSTNFNLASISFVGTVDNVSVKEVQGFSAPSVDNPTSAFKLVEDTSTGTHYVLANNSTISGEDYTQSVYVKPDGRFLQMTGSTGFASSYINYDLDSGTMHLTGAGTATGTITLLSNGFYRCTYTDESTLTGVGSRIIVVLSSSFTSSRLPSYTGDGTSGVYIFGAQLEQKSHSTSYIPTQGGIETRFADTASQTVPDGVINSVEGTMFVEMAALANDLSERWFTIQESASTFDNQINFRYSATTNLIQIVSRAAGLGQDVVLSYTLTDETDFSKIAFRWALNDWALAVNGVVVDTVVSSTAFTSNSLDSFISNRGNSTNYFYGKVNNLQLYKTALTDAELTSLTTI